MGRVLDDVDQDVLPPRGRKRAVRLTPSSLQMLRTALYEQWGDSPGGKKLTREECAARFGVSVVTADRIMRREGVDRTTLVLAFSRLGLEWKEQYCDSPSASNNGAREILDDSVPVSSPDRTEIGRRMLLRWGIAVAATALVAGPVSVYLWLHSRQPISVAPHRTLKTALLINQATREFQNGAFDTAKAHSANAVQMAKELRDMGTAAEALRMAGDIALEEGDLAAARARFEEAITIRRVLDQPVTIPPILEAQGELERQAGDFHAARTKLTESLRRFREQGDPVGVAMCQRDLITVDAKTDSFGAAQNRFEAALKALRGRNKPEIEQDARSRWAVVLRDNGRLDEARAILLECLSFWWGQNHPRWVAVCRLELGSVELLAGNRITARTLLEQSMAEFEKIRDRLGMAQCKKWLAQLVASSG